MNSIRPFMHQPSHASVMNACIPICPTLSLQQDRHTHGRHYWYQGITRQRSPYQIVNHTTSGTTGDEGNADGETVYRYNKKVRYSKITKLPLAPEKTQGLIQTPQAITQTWGHPDVSPPSRAIATPPSPELPATGSASTRNAQETQWRTLGDQSGSARCSRKNKKRTGQGPSSYRIRMQISGTVIATWT